MAARLAPPWTFILIDGNLLFFCFRLMALSLLKGQGRANLGVNLLIKKYQKLPRPPRKVQWT
jgi:hypothetical protein